MNDYFDEIENKAFQKEVLNSFAEADVQANETHNKICIDIMYKTCQSLTAYNNLIMSENNLWEPVKLTTSKINMSPFILFGLFKRGLITDPLVYNACLNLYNKFKNFHKDLGIESFMHFLSIVCIGYTRADKYYSEHIETVIENQIKDLEKELNNA
ncbi:MAG: hypothetical protein MJ211_09665 [Bacteroidales bacterium]|nr:hypothetical protein [Bacteroidales bacterium]